MPWISSAVIKTEQMLRAVDFETASQIADIADFSGMGLRRLPSNLADDMNFRKHFFPDFCVCMIERYCVISELLTVLY